MKYVSGFRIWVLTALREETVNPLTSLVRHLARKRGEAYNDLVLDVHPMWLAVQTELVEIERESEVSIGMHTRLGNC